MSARRIRETHIFALSAAYIAATWGAVLLIDVGNVLGSRDLFDRPVWVHLFANGRPTEWLQWYALGATAIIAAFASGTAFASGRSSGAGTGPMMGHARFWAIMAVAFVLMLVEDAGDVRHAIRTFVELASGLPRNIGMLDRGVELAYFAVVASVPVYALLRYGRHLRPYPTTLYYVLAGFGFYAIAAVSSATRHWGAWYAQVGLVIQERFDMVVTPGETPAGMGHWLIDALLEETVELIGATFFLAAAISYLRIARAADGGGALARVSDRGGVSRR
jgi:hypothetical protein